MVSLTARPETVHDFGRFDRRLFEMRYPAPGAPEVGRRAAELLGAAGIAARSTTAQGYDHGVWTPLMLLFPAADIPIAQVSIQPRADPAHHYRIGDALRPLRDEGVMIVGSGAMTHNLAAYFHQPVHDDSVAPWVAAYTAWMKSRLEARDVAALLDYRRQAPFAAENHPEDEHLLPLFVPLGASHPGEAIRQVHASVDRGVLAMDVYRFG
jgi:4,5-DOPA dioxygenase extradiol